MSKEEQKRKTREYINKIKSLANQLNETPKHPDCQEYMMFQSEFVLNELECLINVQNGKDEKS